MTMIRTLLPAHTLPRRCAATAMTTAVTRWPPQASLAAVLGLGAAPGRRPPAASGRDDVDGRGERQRPGEGHKGRGLVLWPGDPRGGQVRIADGTTVRTVNAAHQLADHSRGTTRQSRSVTVGRSIRGLPRRRVRGCHGPCRQPRRSPTRPASDPVVAHATATFYGQPMTAGDIYTVASNGQPGSTGDGGPATAARLDLPRAVTFDGAGNLVIADTGSNRSGWSRQARVSSTASR